MEFPNLAEIRGAAARIAPYARRTPVMTSATLDEMFGARVFFKCENLQKVGAFKFRGACNAIFSLPAEEAARGIVTHSSGNHAAAVALGARLRGVPAYIAMPENSSPIKKIAVSGYGGQIFLFPPNPAAREAAKSEIIRKTGAAFVHPFNDLRVIAGQATAALELVEEVGRLDVIMAPVGGGGLLSGTALGAAAISPGTKVIAAEPEEADDAYRSLKEGRIMPSVSPKTIADGLLTSLGDLTFPIIQKHVSEIVTVSEKAIVAGMRLIWERMKIVIEPSAAVPVGVFLEKKIDLTGKRVGVILSGGNVDLDHLPWK
jgi:threonine dehydratase